MTGDQNKMGMDVRNGISLADAEWNSRGGVPGKEIDLLVGDDQRDPKEAVYGSLKTVSSENTGNPEISFDPWDRKQ